MSEDLRLTLDDIHQYVVRFGMDIFPPLELANEQFRAQSLYRTLTESWPLLFSKLSLSATEFAVSGRFRAGTAEAEVQTFGYSPRGPVVTFPCKLGGFPTLDYDDKRCVAEYRSIAAAVEKAFPSREVLRVGMVREVVFSTGESRSDNVLMPIIKELAGASFAGGQVSLLFRDQLCNIGLKLNPLEIQRRQQAPSGIARVDHESFGLAIQLDVNNAEMRTMSASDIETVLERAQALWPAPVLEYLNKRIGA